MFHKLTPVSPQGIKFGVNSLETQVSLAELLSLPGFCQVCKVHLESPILKLKGALQENAVHLSCYR